MAWEDSSYHSHLIFTWSRFHGWFFDWVDWNTGILDGIFAFGLSILGSFCSDMLLYIFPARFIHTFCWMEHVRRMEGVVYRFFSFCIVAFLKTYGFYASLVYFDAISSFW